MERAWQRLSSVLSLAGPIVLTALSRQVANILTFVFVGRTGGAEFIGAATLGNMTCNITGFSLAFGLCSALDVLISQAYGAKAYRLTGLYAQRAALILTLAAIPVALLWSQTSTILQVVLGIPADTAKMSGLWARILALGLWPSLMNGVLTKWLQGQKIVWPVVCSSLSAVAFNIICNYTLIEVFGFGFEGPAFTVALMNWFGLIVLIIIIVIRKWYIGRYLRGSNKKTRSGKSTLSSMTRASATTNAAAGGGGSVIKRMNRAAAVRLKTLGKTLGKKLAPKVGDEVGGNYSSVPEEALDTSIHFANGVIMNDNNDNDYSDDDIEKSVNKTHARDYAHQHQRHSDGSTGDGRTIDEAVATAAADIRDSKIVLTEMLSAESSPLQSSMIATGSLISISGSLDADKNKNTTDPAGSQSPIPLRKQEGVKEDVKVEEEDDPEDNWPALSIAVFEEWGQFLKLGIPGALSLFLEWGSFELAASIAAKLGPVALAVHGVYMSTASTFYMVPQAIALATATVTGNALGAEQPEEAAEVVRVGICIDFIYGILAGSLLLFVLRPYWGLMYTSDVAVQKLVYSAMPVMFVYMVVDSTKCVTLNILRSTGRPQITVWGNIVSCALIMQPMGWLLAIRYKLGLTGLWLGMSCAWLAATVVYLTIVLATDWKTQVIIKGKGSGGNEEKKKEKEHYQINEYRAAAVGPPDCGTSAAAVDDGRLEEGTKQVRVPAIAAALCK